MTDDTLLPFAFPAVARKKVTAAFDGGRITSDGGVMLFAAADRRLGIRASWRLRSPTGAIPTASSTFCRTSCAPASWRSPAALRMPTISTGCASIRRSSWPATGFPTAAAICARSRRCRVGRTLPPARVDPADGCHGRSLLRELCLPPEAVTLDIDDTVDVVHGHQQLSLFNAHYDERCFLPIHVYDTATSRPVAIILRPGKTPRATSPWPSAPPDPAHPSALAGDSHHHPRRRPLWSARSDGVVRAQRHRLCVRAARQRGARPRGRRGRR